VHYEKRTARLVLRGVPPRESARATLRPQTQQIAMPQNTLENGPYQMAQPREIHIRVPRPPMDMPYGPFQLLSPYHCPPTTPTSAGRLPVPIVRPEHFHGLPNPPIRNVGDYQFRNDHPPPPYEHIHGVFDGDDIEGYHPGMALRVLRQELIRPMMQGQGFAIGGHYHQPHPLSRPAVGAYRRPEHRRVDTRCPPVGRVLEARIRESLARSGLLRDCPEPEYVNKPAILDPAVVAYGPVTSRRESGNHCKTKSHSSVMELSEENLRESRNELRREPVMIDGSQMNMRRKERGYPFKGGISSGASYQTQMYRGVESKFQALKRMDQNRSYDDEVGPKFLTKEDYTPTRRIIGYYVDPPAGGARSTRKVVVRASEPLVENVPTSPRKTNKVLSEPNIRKEESNDEFTLPEPAQMIVDVTDVRPKTPHSVLSIVERPSPMKLVKIIDVTSNASANPPRSPTEKSGSNSQTQVKDYSNNPTEQPNNLVSEKVEKADPLEDCIRSLATWNKGDREKLQKLLEVLKTLDTDGSSRPSSPTNTNVTIIRGPRKERKSASSLNPHAACFNDFSSVREHVTENRKDFHQRQGVALHETFADPPIFHQEPHLPMGPIWIKTQPHKFIRPPPGLPIPIRAPAGKAPSEDDEGRMAFPMDQRISEPLLARFVEKYPLTGTTAPAPLPSPPTELKTAAQIQEQLERLLLQEKEKKAFRKFQ
jgi:hypothetical protein